MQYLQYSDLSYVTYVRTYVHVCGACQTNKIGFHFLQNPNHLDHVENWVLCRIFSKKGIGGMKNNDGVINEASSDDKVENFGTTVSSSTTDHLGTQTTVSSSSSSSSSQ